MDVRVDKAGQHELAAHVDLDRALVMLAHARDEPLGYGNVAVTELIAEDIYIRRILEHKVGLLPAGGHLDDVKLLVQLAVDPACVAFRYAMRIPPYFVVFDQFMCDTSSWFTVFFYRILRSFALVQQKKAESVFSETDEK